MNDVKSAVRVLELLELLAQSQRPLALKEVVEELGYPKSSAHNLLATLVYRGYATRDAHDRYSLNSAYRNGPGWVCGPDARLIELAAPIMRELRDRCGETVMLGVLNRDSRLKTIAMEVGNLAVRYDSPLASNLPSYCSAMGRMLLAYADEQQVARYLAKESIQQYTRFTLVEVAAIQAEIAKARVLGYAISDQEMDVGGSGVSAPVFAGEGRVVAALNIAAVSSRFGENRAHIIEQVREFATRLSQRMARVGLVTE